MFAIRPAAAASTHLGAGAAMPASRGPAPRLHETCYAAPAASIVGDVEIGPQSSVWQGATLRAEAGSIRIGARVNVQAGTVLNADGDGSAVVIGDDVTIGQMALIHACMLEDGCFVGMKACVMDGAVIEAGAMLAAGSLLTGGQRVPAGQLWAGTPARYVRDLTEDETIGLAAPAAHYVKLGQAYLAELQERSALPVQAAGPVCRHAESRGANVVPMRPAGRAPVSADARPAQAAHGATAGVATAAHASRIAANGRRSRAAFVRRTAPGRPAAMRLRAAG